MASYERSETHLIRTDLPIGGHEVNATITRIYPYVEGTSKLEFRFGPATRWRPSDLGRRIQGVHSARTGR